MGQGTAELCDADMSAVKCLRFNLEVGGAFEVDTFTSFSDRHNLKLISFLSKGIRPGAERVGKLFGWATMGSEM